LEEKRNVYKVLVRISEGERLVGRTRHKDLKEGGVDWIHLPQNRDKWWAVVKALKNF
jgi:hypothetical protein